MSFIQKLALALLPSSWARSMEAESRAWKAHCEVCGSKRSVWDIGGIRWKAAGNPRRRLACSNCGRVTWQRLGKT